MSTPTHVSTPTWLTLDRGEQVWVRARPSNNLLLATFAVGTVLLVVFGVVAAVGDIGIGVGRLASFAILLFIFLLTGAVYLVTRRREYVVTSRRICEAVGLTSKEVSAVDADDVADVTVDQSTWQSWLGVGDLEFVTADGETVRFTAVENPHWIHERVRQSVEGADGS